MRIPHWLRIALSWLLYSGSACALEIGDAAPKIGKLIPDQANRMQDLDEILRTGHTLVYFYPKADTPGCTKQGCSVRDNTDRLAAAGVQVIGVSADTVQAQAAFADKFSFAFALLADREKAVISAFGVPTAPVLGLPARQAFLFSDGKLMWMNKAVSPSEMVDEVLASLAKKN